MAEDLMRELTRILAADTRRWRALTEVSALSQAQCWIGAGFVRNAVWAALHQRQSPVDAADIDIVHFTPQATAALDIEIEGALTRETPRLRWSVKNQARMAARNGDRPYRSLEDALGFWPETATAIAVRREQNELQVCAPYGLADLFGLLLRPTPAFRKTKAAIFQRRLTEKQWLEQWPGLRRIGEPLEA